MSSGRHGRRPIRRGSGEYPSALVLSRRGGTRDRKRVMDMSKLAPRELHPALAWLGRIPGWLSLEPGLDGSADVRLHVDVLRTAPGYAEHCRAVHLLMGPESSAMDVVLVEAMAAVFSGGPKLFSPSAEQAESMRHVDCRVPMTEYQQPYPAMVVALPGRAPVVVRRAPGYLFTAQRHSATEDMCYLARDSILVTVEDALSKSSAGPRDAEAELDARASINLMLMLAHYGCRDAGWHRPLEHADRAARFPRLAVSDFREVVLDREVTVRMDSKRACLGGSHASPATHWRRGHWRNAAVGVGRAEQRLVFVRPVLVRAFSGPAPASTTYTGGL